jgi:hypothetical protein
MPTFDTTRPTYGEIGSVFADEGLVTENFLKQISDRLDQGDGWVLHSEDAITWYPNQLGVQVCVRNDPSDVGLIYAEMQIEIVENVKEYNESTLNLMNILNVQSSGWLVWANHEQNTISLSTRIPIRKEEWWWVVLLTHIIPLATTVADSNMDEFAEVSGGKPAIRVHPEKGIRDQPDSWLESARRGPREFTASMGLMVTGLDLSSMQDALRELCPEASVGIWDPLTVCLFDTNEMAFCMLREHWQSERGLGWQFSSIDSEMEFRKMKSGAVTSEELGIVATRNMELMLNDSWMAILGGWIAVTDFGLVRQWFIDAFLVEEVSFLSQSSFGNVSALMLNSFEGAYHRAGSVEVIDDGINHNDHFEAAMKILNLTSGRLNNSTYFSNPLDFQDDASLWLIPRQSIICSFGIFNPAGPTVSSLELGIYEKSWALYFVLRHPFGEQVSILGTTQLSDPDDQISQMIEDALAGLDEGVLGSGPHWMDIRMEGYSDAIIRGLRRFANSSIPSDLNDDCQRVLHQQGDPWHGISGSDPLEDEYEIDDLTLTWIGLVTSPNVIFGHRAFMRSAWEGAKLFVEADFSKAQEVSNSIIFAARERILDDFHFRNSVGALIQDPMAEPEQI